jgi:translation initiation factor 2 alpha subunit (eIF-2alpha)
MEIKEGDVVMCTVKKIEGTNVFLNIEGNGEGTMSLPEVAAGRIRNLREYVSPNKKIVCKVLKISKDHIDLSLRRVTAKERDEMKNRYQKERTLLGMLKASVKNAEEVLEKIKENFDVATFAEEARVDSSILLKLIKKEEALVLSKILAEKREKEKIVKRELVIKSLSPAGIEDIKSALQSAKNVEMHYLGSSRFSISASGKDFKEAEGKMEKALAEVQKRAKEKKLFLEIKEK